MSRILLLFLMVIICISPASAQNAAKNDSTKKVNLAFIPFVNYNNSLGIIGGAMGSMFYKLNKNDTISPSSSTMLVGLYTGNKSHMGLVAQKFYMREDNWRSTLVAGTGTYYFQFFQGLPFASAGRYNDKGIWIDYDTSLRFFLADIQRQLFDGFYLGAEVLLMHAETTFELPVGELKPQTVSDMNSLGYTLLFDNRDDVNFPVSGWFVNYKNRFIREWFGASEEYTNFELSANKFFDLKENGKSIIVARIYSNIASGDVPFQGQNFIGGDDLRGYSKGEYRGNQVYAIQTELRQNIYKKWGLVAFGGLATAVNDFNEIGDASILPGIGVGLRYMMIAKEKVNVGMDVGVGKNDWSLTFRIGEAFSR